MKDAAGTATSGALKRDVFGGTAPLSGEVHGADEGGAVFCQHHRSEGLGCRQRRPKCRAYVGDREASGRSFEGE
jgi:hypothetical protein